MKHPRIDPRLASWSRKLKPQEFSKLEAQIIEAGRATDPLILWKGKRVVVDGHNRLAICRKHNLPYVTEEKEFADVNAAKMFMRERQLGRRNVDDWDLIIAASDLVPIYEAEAKKRMKSGKKIDPRRNSAEGTEITGKGSVLDKLAHHTGLKRDQLREGMAAWRKGSVKLREKIRNGELTPHGAFRRFEIERYLELCDQKKQVMPNLIGVGGYGDYQPGELDKIVTGDALEVLRRVPPDTFALVFTSPPYITYQTGPDGKLLKDEKGERIETPFGDWLAWMKQILTEVHRILRLGGRCVLNLDAIRNRQDDSEYFRDIHFHIGRIAREVGLKFYQAVVWHKGAQVGKKTARGTKRSCKRPVDKREHEEVIVFSKGTFDLLPLAASIHKENGKAVPLTDIGDDWAVFTTSVWQIAQTTTNKCGHPFPFPERLADLVIRKYSYVGDNVCDCFSGRGTTAVAAMKSGRHFLGIDCIEKWNTFARQWITDEAVKRRRAS